MSLLAASEPLWTRGRRLHDTPVQRQGKVYSPDVFSVVQVEGSSQRLSASFVEDGQLVVEHGECCRMHVWLSNTGTESIDEIWIVGGPEEEYWIDDRKESAGNILYWVARTEYLSLSK